MHFSFSLHILTSLFSIYLYTSALFYGRTHQEEVFLYILGGRGGLLLHSACCLHVLTGGPEFLYHSYKISLNNKTGTWELSLLYMHCTWKSSLEQVHWRMLFCLPWYKVHNTGTINMTRSRQPVGTNSASYATACWEEPAQHIP